MCFWTYCVFLWPELNVVETESGSTVSHSFSHLSSIYLTHYECWRMQALSLNISLKWCLWSGYCFMSTPSTSSQIRERKQFQGVMTPARDAVLGKNESIPVQNQTDGWQKKQVSHVRRRQRVRITAYRWMLGGGGGGAAGGNVWKASSSIVAAEWWRLKSFVFSSAASCVLIISLYHMSYKASWCNVTTGSMKCICYVSF